MLQLSLKIILQLQFRLFHRFKCLGTQKGKIIGHHKQNSSYPKFETFKTSNYQQITLSKYFPPSLRS